MKNLFIILNLIIFLLVPKVGHTQASSAASAAGTGAAGAGAAGAEAGVAGGLTASGSSLMDSPPTIAAGVAMLSMAALEFAASGNESKSAGMDGISSAATKYNPIDNTTKTIIDPANQTTITSGVPNSQTSTGFSGGATMNTTGATVLGDSRWVNDKLNQIKDQLGAKGITFDTSTFDVTMPNGDKFNAHDLRPDRSANLPDSMQDGFKKAWGIASEIAAREKEKAGFGKDSSMQAALKGLNSSLKGDGSSVGSSGMQSGGEGSAVAADGDKSRKNGDVSGLVNGREPASAKIAGLSKNFNGDLIGVSADNIFTMVTRRYELKTKENSFINDLINTVVPQMMSIKK